MKFTYNNLLKLLFLLLAISLSNCGFKLRTTNNTPFYTLYTNIENQQLVNKLSFLLKSKANIELVNEKNNAQLYLDILSDNKNTEIFSYDTQGLVREHKINRTILFRLQNLNNQNIIIPPTLMEKAYIISFPEEKSLAKQQEEQQLLENMEKDLLNQLVYRITLSTQKQHD